MELSTVESGVLESWGGEGVESNKVFNRKIGGVGRLGREGGRCLDVNGVYEEGVQRRLTMCYIALVHSFLHNNTLNTV